MAEISKSERNSLSLKQDGGIVRCRKCGRVAGFIHERNHKYISYIFVCKCTNVGKVEICRGDRPRLKSPGRKIYEKHGVHICPNCERELFWVKEDAVLNYSFGAVCACGVEYDTKYKIKSLGGEED